MSTYLLTCIVGKFSFCEAITKTGVVVRGYTPEDQSECVKEYVKLASEAVDYYTDFFGIPYPLPKLDLVSIHKMAISAMENWGCITFA